MATNTRSTLFNLLVEGIKEHFGTGYEQYDKTYLKFFDYVKSNGETEQYQETGGFGLHSVKAEASTAALDTVNQGPKTYIENIAYAKRYLISHELMADNKYQKAVNDALDLGRSAANTIEVACINRLNTAFSTAAADILADGSAMCATGHALSGSGGTSSNAAGTPSALSETSLTTAMTTIAGLVDPRGNKLQARAEMLIVPQESDIAAQKLLHSTLMVGGNNNDLNPYGRSWGRLPKGYVTVQDLTDTNAFFIRTNIRGLVFQEREKARIMEDFQNASMTKELVSYLRFGVGCFDFRSIYGNAGA